jgi:hypothetical protein
MTRLFMICAVACSSAVILSACGEVDQSKSAGRHLPDVEPWQGAKNAFVVQGWQAGDKSSWEKQIHTRQQNQNEYLKTN